MLIEVKVKGLTLDPLTSMAIILLRAVESKKTLPFWVGIFEANAIAVGLENEKSPRPMTHDLLKNVLEELGGRLERVVINDLRDGTYFAHLDIWVAGEKVKVDSRPSDAIALSVRFKVPIFVDSEVFEKAKGEETIPPSNEEKKKLANWLKNLKPEDFGEYPV